MESNQITEKVLAVLTSALNVDSGAVTPDLAFGDMPQWDSMGHMEVMVSLEESFGVEVNADTISNLISVPAIVAHITTTVGEQ